MNMVKEFKVTVRQFLTKPSTNPKFADKKPVPFRVMFGYITQETANTVHFVLRAKPQAASHCMRCGREITHPISLLYGFGPECITKVPFAVPLADPSKLDEYLKDLQSKMADIIWSGSLPKGHFETEDTGNLIEPFLLTPPQPQAKPTITRVPITIPAPVPKVDPALVNNLLAELGF